MYVSKLNRMRDKKARAEQQAYYKMMAERSAQRVAKGLPAQEPTPVGPPPGSPAPF
jgi:hypothetical protein